LVGAAVVGDALDDMKWSFKRAFPSNEFTPNKIKVLMRKLLKAGNQGLPLGTFLSLLPKDLKPAEVKKILQEEVLSFNSKETRVRFSSDLARTYAQVTYGIPPKRRSSARDRFRALAIVSAPLITAGVLYAAQKKL